MKIEGHCSEEDLLAYGLDEMEWPRRADVAAHIEYCPLCRSRLDELLFEFKAIAESMDRDHLLSPERVEAGRIRVAQRIRAFERSSSLVAPRRRLRSVTLAARVAVAVAAVLVLIFAAGRYYEGGDSRLPDGEVVLAKVRNHETVSAAGPVYQKIHVEILPPASDQQRLDARLEVWCEPETARYAARLADDNGTLRRAVWSGLEQAGPFLYEDSHPRQLLRAERPQLVKAVSLLGIRQFAFRPEGLAAGFMEWLKARPWRPVLFTEGMIGLVDRYGTRLRIERLVVARQEVLRLAASRNLDGVTTEVTLDVRAGDYQPVLLCIRFRSDGRTAELRLRMEEKRFLNASSLDTSVFEPRLPLASEALWSRERRRPASVSLPARKLAAFRRPAPKEMLAARLRLQYAIHQAGACLYEHFEFSEDEQGRLQVTGIVSTVETESRIRDQLSRAGLPEWVTVKIMTVDQAIEAGLDAVPAPEAERSLSGSPAGSLVLASGRLPIQSELEAYFSKHPYPGEMENSSIPAPTEEVGRRIMRFTGEAISLADDLSAHAAVLRELSQQYGAEADLDGDSSRLLMEMLRDHLSAFRAARAREMSTISAVLGGIFRRSAGLIAPPTEGPSGSGLPEASLDWKRAISRLYRETERMHNNVTALLSVTVGSWKDKDPSGSVSPISVHSLFRAMRAVNFWLEEADREVSRRYRASVMASKRTRRKPDEDEQ